MRLRVLTDRTVPPSAPGRRLVPAVSSRTVGVDSVDGAVMRRRHRHRRASTGTEGIVASDRFRDEAARSASRRLPPGLYEVRVEMAAGFRPLRRERHLGSRPARRVRVDLPLEIGGVAKR